MFSLVYWSYGESYEILFDKRKKKRRRSTKVDQRRFFEKSFRQQVNFGVIYQGSALLAIQPGMKFAQLGFCTTHGALIHLIRSCMGQRNRRRRLLDCRLRELQLFGLFLTLPLVPCPSNFTLADEPAGITILLRICTYKQPAAHSARPEHQLAKISHFLSPGVQYNTKFYFCIDSL